MNEYRIVLTSRAKNDIIDIGDYISFTLLSSDTSQNFIKGLRNSISQLKSFPLKFPLVQDEVLQAQGIRCMPYKNHYIFYKVFSSHQIVVILRIGYNRQNWKKILT